MSKQKITTAVIAFSFLACENSQFGTAPETISGNEQISSVAQATMSIENNKIETPDPVLRLNLKSDSEIAMVKVSSNDSCQGGEWFDYTPDFKIMTPVVNDIVTISVQYMYLDGSISDCLVDDILHDNPNTPVACETNPEVCDREPQVKSAGVVTVLLTLGDELNQELIINGSSAQVIAEMAVRFASPVVEPKILVVRDRLNMGESYQDTEYIAKNLLSLYKSVTLIDEPVSGIQDADLAGYDLVWFNNPGHPMSSASSRDTLSRFSGGVVLSGDDMSYGRGFSMESLTGLRHLDNGASVTCAGISYRHDNNQANQFRVNLDSQMLPGFPESLMNFRYGNDIDNSVVVQTSVEVIARAKGGPESCQEDRPVITRYAKN